MTILDILPHILLPISMITPLALPAFQFRGIIFTATILSLAYWSIKSPFPSDSQMRYAVAQSWFFYIPTISKVLIPYEHLNKDSGFRKDAEHAYWHRAHINEAATMTFGWKKIKWALALWINPRGVGWNYQDKSVVRMPPQTKTSKGVFLRQRVADVLLYYMITDVVIYYLASFGFPEALEEMGWMDKIKIAAVSAVMIRGNWQFQWSIASLVGVGCGLSEPEDWPSFSGPLNRVTTIAYFWGTYWQQVLHESLLTYSRFIVSFFGIRRHGTIAYAIHLFTGFVITGVFHVFSLNSTGRVPVRDIFINNMFFFMMQPIGILLEMAFEYIHYFFYVPCPVVDGNAKKSDKTNGSVEIEKRLAGFGYVGRTLGYIWVISFLFFTGWPFLEIYLHCGMSGWKMPFPVTELLMRSLLAK